MKTLIPVHANLVVDGNGGGTLARNFVARTRLRMSGVFGKYFSPDPGVSRGAISILYLNSAELRLHAGQTGKAAKLVTRAISGCGVSQEYSDQFMLNLANVAAQVSRKLTEKSRYRSALCFLAPIVRFVTESEPRAIVYDALQAAIRGEVAGEDSFWISCSTSPIKDMPAMQEYAHQYRRHLLGGRP